MRGRYECKNETPGPGWGSVVEHPFSMHRPWVPSIPSAKITKTQNKSHRGKIKKKKNLFHQWGICIHKCQSHKRKDWSFYLHKARFLDGRDIGTPFRFKGQTANWEKSCILTAGEGLVSQIEKEPKTQQEAKNPLEK
jgi:hypothetical protein